MKKLVAAPLISLFFFTAAPLWAQDAGSQGTCSPDNYEPNDTDTAAAPIAVGEHNDLTACIEDGVDWYSIDVSSGEGLVVDLSFIHDDADLDLHLYDAAAPGVVLDHSVSSEDSEQAFVELSVDYMTVLIKVTNFDAHNNKWAAYDMTVTLYPGGYQACGEGDALEPNNEFDDAAFLTLPFSDATLSICDDDWYVFSAPAGQGIRATMHFVHADADINMAIFEQDNTNVPLMRARGTDDTETVCVIAQGESQVLLLHVYEQGGLKNASKPYSLNVELSNEACPGNPDPVDAGSSDTATTPDAAATPDAATPTDDKTDGETGLLCGAKQISTEGVFLALVGLSLLALIRLGHLRRRGSF